MRIAIVGSRSFPALDSVEAFVDGLPNDTTVVSGGAKGVDRTAAARARARGLEVDEKFPELEECTHRHEFTRRFYARNEAIASSVDRLVAFTERDSGGTWDAIRRARKHGIPVDIVRS